MRCTTLFGEGEASIIKMEETHGSISITGMPPVTPLGVVTAGGERSSPVAPPPDVLLNTAAYSIGKCKKQHG